MPSIPQQTISAAGIDAYDVKTEKGLAVLKITNESVNPMYFITRSGHDGDLIPPNYGSCAYHYVDGDRPPSRFWVAGTAGDTWRAYFEVRDEK